MKICYDNLEKHKIYLKRTGNFGSKNDSRRIFYYKDQCSRCENPFLANNKYEVFCSNSCSMKSDSNPRTGKKRDIVERNKISSTMQGRIFTKEHKNNISISKLADKNPQWKGGITPFKKQIRHFIRIIHWSQNVFERDEYTCYKCKRIGGKLHGHHIITISNIIEKYNIKNISELINCRLIFDIENGLTLCKECHQWVHSNNNIEKEYLEFLC